MPGGNGLPTSVPEINTGRVNGGFLPIGMRARNLLKGLARQLACFLKALGKRHGVGRLSTGLFRTEISRQMGRWREAGYTPQVARWSWRRSCSSDFLAQKFWAFCNVCIKGGSSG